MNEQKLKLHYICSHFDIKITFTHLILLYIRAWLLYEAVSVENKPIKWLNYLQIAHILEASKWHIWKKYF